MNPLPDFTGFARALLGAEPDLPITDAEIARNARKEADLRRHLAALDEMRDAA